MKRLLCMLLGHRWRRVFGEPGLFHPRGSLDVCERCTAVFEMRPYPPPPLRRCSVSGCPRWDHWWPMCLAHRELRAQAEAREAFVRSG